MNDGLARLLALSETDAALRTLAGRLADLDREEAHLRARLGAEDDGFRRRQEESRALRLASLAKSGEADDTDARIRTYQHKLDHDIIPYKEMEHLREQVEFLRTRLDELADEALRLMTEADADEEGLKAETGEHRGRRARLEADIAALEHQRSGLLADRDALQAERDKLAQAVPGSLRGHYERILSSGGTPVVSVTGGVCDGCHLRLAATTVEKVRADREAATCEHCSRFLYLRPS